MGDYLKVQYHLVGTSNNAKNPFTVIGEVDREQIFHVGLYQDTTDQHGGPRRSGHYQSLEHIPGLAVPCCKIQAEMVTVSVPIERDVTIDVQKTLEAEAIERIKLEEEILKMFKTDENMIKVHLNEFLRLRM